MTYQAGEGVVHAVLQGELLQEREQSGVLKATRSCRRHVLEVLPLRWIHT